MTTRLAGILSPVLPSEFFRRCEHREYLHVRRARTGTYDDILRTVALDEFLNSGILPAGSINVVKDGVQCPHSEWSKPRSFATGTERVVVPERLLGLFRDGATLILNTCDQAVLTLGQACRELERELGLKVQANVYVTPPGGQGFGRHGDHHDVVVLQIAGSKSWRVYPFDPEMGISEGVEVEMMPGDLLYIPCGMEHEARCLQESSIHITLGLYPVYGFQLLADLAERAAKDCFFQKPLRGEFAGDEERDAFEAGFRASVERLLREQGPARLLHDRRNRLILEQPSGWPGRFLDTLQLNGGMTSTTVLCSRPGMGRRIEVRQEHLEVIYSGNTTCVPRFLSATLDRMLSDVPFAIGELPGMLTPEGRISFVRPFVEGGLLTIRAI